MTAMPSWGVLVKAPAEQVASILLSLREQFGAENFVFQIAGDWVAVFYMEPSPTSEMDGADALRLAGLDAAQLDFDRDRYHVNRWHGRWTWTGEDPVDVCAEVGITVPGHDLPTLPVRPFRPSRTRAVSLVEGMTASEVEAVLGDSDVPDFVETAARGALVTKHPFVAHEPTYEDLSERVPAHVYHLEFDPEDGRFVCLSLRDGVLQTIFEIGNTWIRRDAPVVENVEGETTPVGIVKKLGIPESFLANPG